MSADNGIYILRTNDGYRVAELFYPYTDLDHSCTGCPCDRDNDIRIKSAREIWKAAEYFKDEIGALVYASGLADKCTILEHGICTIFIPRDFEVK